MAQRILEDLDRGVDVAALDVERGEEADRPLAAAEEEQAALEGRVDDPIATFRVERAVGALEDVDRQHEPEAARRAQLRERREKGLEPAGEIVAHDAGVLEQSSLDEFDRPESRGARKRIPAERVRVGAARPLV